MVVVIAVVVVVATVVVVVVVVGGGAVAGVGNSRCQKGKVDQGSTGFTLTFCNNHRVQTETLLIVIFFLPAGY